MSADRTPTRYPGRIIVTADRARKDMGDIRGLARSIERDGLLRPVVVTTDNRLVAGARQLEAWRYLDRWDTPIPVRVVDIDAIARGEWAENVYRKELTWSERVHLVRALRPALQEAARERQRVLGRHHGVAPIDTPVAQFAPKGGRTRDLLARGLGVSSRSFEKAEAVVEFAELDPVRGLPLVDAMDRSGRVHGPHGRLRVIRQADQLRAEPPPLPSRGPYRVQVIDFPWFRDVDATDQSERGTHGYPLMTWAQIQAMAPEIRALGHDDSVLWLWTTNHHLPYALQLLPTFGYEHRTVLTWEKDQMGRGDYLREITEHCILAIRGRPVVTGASHSTILKAPRGGHSQKPAAFYDLVEAVTPASRYCELYPHLQPPRLNWDRNYIGEPPAAAIETPIAAETDGAYRIPRGPTVPELLRPGMPFTNRGSRGSWRQGPVGACIVEEVYGPWVSVLPGGRTVETWTVLGHTIRRSRGLSRPVRLTDLVAVDGRVLKLDSSDDDEVLVGPDARLEAAS